MKLRRPSRFVAALLALFGMLFMQLAVAAYVCEETQVHTSGSSIMSTQPEAAARGMPDCGSYDTSQPGLCQAHAQNGNQSLDKPNAPLVSQFVPAVLAAVSGSPRTALAPIEARYRLPALTRSVAPPLSISNCCFRI
jgi:hypothetical protein